MKRAIKIKHKTGYWGFSSALAQSLSYYGYNIDEKIAFGISAAIGFKYLKGEKFLPARTLLGVEGKPSFYYSSYSRENLNWHSGREFPWKEMKKYLDNEIPVMVIANPLYLPYISDNNSFTSHFILLVDYNETSGKVLVSDNLKTSPVTLSLDDLAHAMNHIVPPLLGANYWLPLEKPDYFNLEYATKRGILRTVVNMLFPKSNFEGIYGMRRFAQDMGHWKEEVKGARWCAMHCIKSIAGSDTDGGNYRYLYSEFLKEAESILPELRRSNLGSYMEYSGRMWQELAVYLREYIEENDSRILKQCSNLLIQIAREEEGVYREIFTKLTGKTYRSYVITAAQ